VASYFHGLVVQPDCHRCPLQHDPKVYPDGPIPTKICIVGEEPGHMEVERGRGFIGPSGQLLWHLAAGSDLSRDDVWITNAALCKARDVRLSTGGVLRVEQVKFLAVQACRRRLIGELYAVTQGDPRAVIVPIGNLALQSLKRKRGLRIFARRGSIEEVDIAKEWALLQQNPWTGIV